MSTESKTMAMKARVFNQIRKDINQKHLEENFYTKYKDQKVLKEAEKLELFNKWFTLAKEAHGDLASYKRKRKGKKRIYEARVERGYKFKKKVSKEDYLKQRV